MCVRACVRAVHAVPAVHEQPYDKIKCLGNTYIVMQCYIGICATLT